LATGLDGGISADNTAFVSYDNNANNIINTQNPMDLSSNSMHVSNNLSQNTDLTIRHQIDDSNHKIA
jgi:hypothetical protein